MGNRKLGFKVGDTVVLDRGTSCEQMVEVIEISPLGLLTRVQEGESVWGVMAYRLEPITPSEVNESIKS